MRPVHLPDWHPKSGLPGSRDDMQADLIAAPTSERQPCQPPPKSQEGDKPGISMQRATAACKTRRAAASSRAALCSGCYRHNIARRSLQAVA